MDNTLDIANVYMGWMTVRPDTQGLSAARGKVRSIVEQLQISGEDRAMLILAVGEALSNAYLHGTPDPESNIIRLAWQLHNDTFKISIHDQGPGLVRVDHNINLPRVRGGGCGIQIMQNSVDAVDFHFDFGTKVTLTKYLGSVASAPLRERSSIHHSVTTRSASTYLDVN